jgi:toxin ParE1/3/4
MSLPIRPRSAAEQDVAAHAEYIQRDSLDAAVRFLDAVDAAFWRLGQNPELGAMCRFTNPHYAGMRVWPVPRFRKYLIFYRVTPEEVEVIRVLHGTRDLRIIFGDEEQP